MRFDEISYGFEAREIINVGGKWLPIAADRPYRAFRFAKRIGKRDRFITIEKEEQFLIGKRPYNSQHLLENDHLSERLSNIA